MLFNSIKYPSNPENSSSTELEVPDTEIIGLKCLPGKTGNKHFLLRYKFNDRKCKLILIVIDSH